MEVPKWLVTCGVAAEVLSAGVEGDPAVEVCAGVLRRLLGEELMTANLAPLSAACAFANWWGVLLGRSFGMG